MDFTLVTDGLSFPEGPVILADGSVLVVEIRSGRLTRVAPDGTRTVVAELGGGPNGAAIGPDGAVYVCNNGGLEFFDAAPDLAVPGHAPPDYVSGSIQRIDLASGAVTTLYLACDGRPLRGPNDIVFDADGSHQHVRLPGEIIVTNICFGGPDMRDAWITASGSGRLYHARWPRPGLKLYFNG